MYGPKGEKMNIKGTIKLEITGKSEEQEEINKLIEDLKNDPNLQACKIVVTTSTKSKQKIR